MNLIIAIIIAWLGNFAQVDNSGYLILEDNSKERITDAYHTETYDIVDADIGGL